MGGLCRLMRWVRVKVTHCSPLLHPVFHLLKLFPELLNGALLVLDVGKLHVVLLKGLPKLLHLNLVVQRLLQTLLLDQGLFQNRNEI